MGGGDCGRWCGGVVVVERLKVEVKSLGGEMKIMSFCNPKV